MSCRLMPRSVLPLLLLGSLFFIGCSGKTSAPPPDPNTDLAEQAVLEPIEGGAQQPQ